MPDTFRCDSGHEWQAADPAATCPECGAPGEPTDELPPAPSTRGISVDWSRPPGPPALDGYDVGELVGRGGMAVVYKARQRSLNRPVALKMLLVGPYFGADEAGRIRAEAEAIARLQHPNVVHVYEVGERDGRPYQLMEFVDGGTLADRLKKGPVSTVQAVAWAEAIARGIHAAHRRGIVHRDLKPANVLMTADGVPKITDFGIARRLDDPADRTRTGVVIGTPAYMAPEQAEGRKGVGPPADVWAVGVILYEMLTGRTPFAGGSSFDLLRRVGTEPPPRPSQVRPGVRPRLEAICLKCLEKDPGRRYPTAEALADDLARYRAEPIPAAAPRRHWTVPAAVVAVGLVAVVLMMRPWGRSGGDGNPGPAGGGPPTVPAPNPSPDGAPPPEPVDGKSTWDKLQIAADDETFQRLAFPTRDTGFAASAKGVYRTDDAGQNWKRAWASELSNVYALAFADPDHGWLGADRLYRTDDGGTQWNAVVLPGDVADVRAISVGPGGRGLAAGTGKNGEPILFRLRSGGWALVDPAAWDGPTRPHRTWTVASVAAAGDRDAWAVLYTLAGGGSGVVLHTADGADHWQTSEPFDVSLHHIHFADARRGWLAGFHGKLWTTEDGGGHWTPQANPDPDEVAVSCLAFARSGQAWALAPLLDGRVLLSADGRSWQAVQVELTGLTPDAAVVDPGRAYVLARDGGVARYTDPRFRPKP